MKGHKSFGVLSDKRGGNIEKLSLWLRVEESFFF